MFRRAWTRLVDTLVSNRHLNKFDRVIKGPGTKIYGNCIIAEDAIIGTGAKLSAKNNGEVVIGKNSFVGDRASLESLGSDTRISLDEDVIAMQRAVLIGPLRVGEGAVIGARVVISNSTVGRGSIIYHRSSVRSAEIGEKELWAGNPAKFVREVKDGELKNFRKSIAITRDNMLDSINHAGVGQNHQAQPAGSAPPEETVEDRRKRDAAQELHEAQPAQNTASQVENKDKNVNQSQKGA
ncbi:hypothetical protein NDN08_005482 [Rhodosorus marinus]|uniref:Dynactin subunit 6 n=1 Tax=Rhodosorus marinus TaxID=101924 RepID=A0AAV8V4A2_9RHOD|nr:hypothetical protein NDN08_005482 [Rhodosorus marinus]